MLKRRGEGGWSMFVLGQYTMIIFKRTKIISLMTSWYSKNHLHRSLIFYKIEHHKKVHEKFMSSSSLFEDRKELWKWSQPYILVQISSFLCVFPPQWIHNDLNCTFIYIFLPMKTYLFIVLQQMLIRQKHGYLTFSSIVITAIQ